MDWIEVSCAVIEKNGLLLIAQRKFGDSFAGYWEFPGGKRDPHETMEECLVREIKEELDIEIRPRLFLRNTRHEYPEKKISLFFYLCDWISGKPACKDCQDFKWVTPEELRKYGFPRGDEEVINDLILKKAWYFKPGFRPGPGDF